ncbi:hypothetical protein HYU06_02735 [Candidatus Woesearchaeota archaeon]|nr:hypothetical protein [Candidatus Woesearchaeota archaeon]
MSEQAAKEVNITYETLFEMLRLEKNREELQKIDPEFFSHVLAYLREKLQVLNASKQSIFGDEQQENTRKQLETVKKIIKELYEKREKKIMMMALFKCREKTNVMDTSSILKEEQILFLQLVNILDSFRNSLLMNLLELKEIGTKAVEMPQHKNKGLVNNNRTNTDNNIRSESSNNGANVNTQQITAANENTDADASAALKLLRILEQVPQFVGTDLEVYGPFIPEDVANIPADVANLLVETGSAEQMKNN